MPYFSAFSSLAWRSATHPLSRLGQASSPGQRPGIGDPDLCFDFMFFVLLENLMLFFFFLVVSSISPS